MQAVNEIFLNPWIDKSVWHHQIWKHQNITSILVLMIVFGIHFSFFIVLQEIWLEICRSNEFFFFYKAKCARLKNQARLRAFARTSATNRHRGRNLSRLDRSVSFFYKPLNIYSILLVPSWHNDVVTMLWQPGPDNVVVDVVTTLWQCRKWELWRRQFPALWQRRYTTLPQRCFNAATTSTNGCVGAF